MLEQAFLEPEHVRRTFLYKEYFSASLAPSCRVQIYYVRIKASEQRVYGFNGRNIMADDNIVASEYLEIMFCSLAERLLHLVV